MTHKELLKNLAIIVKYLDMSLPSMEKEIDKDVRMEALASGVREKNRVSTFRILLFFLLGEID